MFGNLGFSYVGFIYLCCLFIPNILYSFNLPKDYMQNEENKILLGFERVGQVACTVLILIFKDFNIHELNLWSIWLGLSAVCIILYLICWIRYFTGERVSIDFFRSLIGIPIPLATLPVLAFLLLSIYGRVIWLSIAVIILGIGHIGITLQNGKSFEVS